MSESIRPNAELEELKRRIDIRTLGLGAITAAAVAGALYLEVRYGVFSGAAEFIKGDISKPFLTPQDGGDVMS